jgi:L-asparaginase
VDNGSQGVIYAGTGNGSLTDEVMDALIEARSNDVIVVRSTRVGSGLVARNGEVDDDELDFVVSNTLNPQKARVLLLLALTQTTDTKEIQQMFYDY